MTRVYSHRRSRDDGARARRLRSAAQAQSRKDLSQRRALPGGPVNAHERRRAPQAAARSTKLRETLARCDRAGHKVARRRRQHAGGHGLAPERRRTSRSATTTLYRHRRLRSERPHGRGASRARRCRSLRPARRRASVRSVRRAAPAVRDARRNAGRRLARPAPPPLRTPARLLLGSTIVLADGTSRNAGGMVVKNVAGYDMSRLYVGSFGTLGVLVQANLKTHPAPAKHARLSGTRCPRERASAPSRTCGDVADPSRCGVLGERFSQRSRRRGRRRGALGRAARRQRRAARTRDARAALGARTRRRTGDAASSTPAPRVVRTRRRRVRRDRGRTFHHLPRYSLPEDQAEERAMEMQRLACRFEFEADPIVDAMNGDVVLRVERSRRARRSGRRSKSSTTRCTTSSRAPS